MTVPATTPARLERGQTLIHEFTLAAAGEASAALVLSAPGTSWARGAAAVVSLEVDGAERQHLVLAAAEEPVAYTRSFGRPSAGRHRLAVRLDAALSPPAAAVVECHGIETGAVSDDDPGAFVWRHIRCCRRPPATAW